MNALPHSIPGSWEIFCRVVDNYGDIGVCWRLARELVARHGVAVRLWVDDWASFARLCPAVAGRSEAQVEGVEVRLWTSAFAAVEIEPAEVVIEAFACELPEAQVAAMARRSPPPLWINLEYLSAEDWVGGCHGLASPHPRLPLVKHFFFPGFGADTGGLLREAGLLAARDRMQGAPAVRRDWLAAHGLGALPDDTLVVSLFAYAQPALDGLLGAWSHGARPLLLLVPEGKVVGDVARALGAGPLQAGARLCRGGLTVAVLPFSDQDAYDRLLWICDLNFVRGEDSFVRAQWAARPFVWHIYAQHDDAHFAKLDAFLARYGVELAPAPRAALQAFCHAWNGDGDPAAAWPALAAALPALAAHARRWSGKLGAEEDLVTRLTAFCNHIRGGAE